MVGVLAVALPLSVHAASTISLTLDIYTRVVDEQNTTAFYNTGETFCFGESNPVSPAGLTGDNMSGPSTAYSIGSPWSSIPGLISAAYVNHTACSGSNCLRVQFNSNGKILTLDTRGTLGPRKVTLSFAQPCVDSGCPGPAGSPSVFGGLPVTTPALLNILLNAPYTSMQVCGSTTCPEAQPAFAKLWFADPVNPNVTWRVDWPYLRLLRVSATTWYFVGDLCDGSQIAGLSQLVGNRTQPKTVFNGYYEIPFFFSASQ